MFADMPRSKRAEPTSSSRAAFTESGMPFGIGAQKPRHYLEMAKVIWENRDALPYAYRVLSEGVCDGCALGTSGLRDWTLSGTHLCLSRLRLLRLNTMSALDPQPLGDVATLCKLSGKRLRELGRLSHPLRRRRGDRGFERVSWDDALADIGARLRARDPDRLACYMTARGITNEVYFATQKALRYLDCPNIDNAARLCHSPSTAAMKRVLGVSASTCSYKDWYGTGLVVLFGSNPANDQPVAMKYLLEAKRLGTRVLVVNPYREPGLARYWVPSSPESALFGSKIADRFFQLAPAGDQAFVYAVQQLIIDRHAEDRAFIREHTHGWDAYRAHIKRFPLATLIARSGASREDVIGFADELTGAKSAVFVWSMGLTQHATGTQTVEALLCLALSLGFVGRERTGLMPIRGHSGVQGGAEMGAYATAFPGGLPIDEANADRLEQRWGFRPPVRTGLDAAAILARASTGELDALYAIGGNFMDTMPDPISVERAIARIPLRIHQDIVLNSSMLVAPADTVYLLPAKTRYEHEGGVTQTTTERRVVFSPFIAGHEIGEARDEWRIPIDIARATRPERAHLLDYADTAAIREDIARCVENYQGIQQLKAAGDNFQWGGPRLCENGQFPLPDARARFVISEPPDARVARGRFRLTTRRGTQWNSLVQSERDGLTGADRDHVLISAQDMATLGIRPGARIRLTSPSGSVVGRAFVADVLPGHVQMHWPEANPLIARGVVDPGGLVPDYNALVSIEAPP
jgi:molybdopterin-dependent oxidoreductase alpha subunit